MGGPFSSELADDYNEIRDNGVPWTEPSDDVYTGRLKGIFDRGEDFTHAYSSLIAIRQHSPKTTDEKVVKHLWRIEPQLGNAITEAASSLGLSIPSEECR